MILVDFIYVIKDLILCYLVKKNFSITLSKYHVLLDWTTSLLNIKIFSGNFVKRKNEDGVYILYILCNTVYVHFDYNIQCHFSNIRIENIDGNEKRIISKYFKFVYNNSKAQSRTLNRQYELVDDPFILMVGLKTHF